jgi:hypothetical protein
VLRTSAIFVGSPLPICGKAASQRSTGLCKESARTRLATLPNPGAGGKEESAKIYGKRSGFGGDFATLPLCHTTRGRPVWEARFPEMGAQWGSRVQALAHRKQAILSRDPMAHQPAFARPDYPTGRNREDGLAKRNPCPIRAKGPTPPSARFGFLPEFAHAPPSTPPVIQRLPGSGCVVAWTSAFGKDHGGVTRDDFELELRGYGLNPWPLVVQRVEVSVRQKAGCEDESV